MELRDDTRPLTARSVVASTLLGVRPSVLPPRSLVASAGLFGIAEGAVRTALSRMVVAGELTLDDGRYALSGPFLSRRERQDESRNGVGGPWDGEWEMAVVEGERRPAADRTALRAAMRALRFGELREGVWLRPANLDPDRLPDARTVVGAQCFGLVARSLLQRAVVERREDWHQIVGYHPLKQGHVLMMTLALYVGEGIGQRFAGSCRCLSSCV